MIRYQLEQRTFGLEEPGAAQLLATVHQQHGRPLCLCTRPGVPMYVALVNGRHILKRMPGTGSKHRPSCDSYESPPELSGLGEVAGAAIQENPEDGSTTLRLDFALTKSPGRAAPVLTGAEKDTVRTDGRKLTLRGTLHFLWHQAGFDRWTPRMAGKRSWPVVRRHLLQAADAMVTKGARFGDSLFLPEAFNLERRDEIARRRGLKLAPLATTTKGSRKLALLVGQVKQLTADRLVVKHLPDLSFLLNPDIRKAIDKHFAEPIKLWHAAPDSHLLVAATFGFTPTGVATVEQLTLMNVSAQWIPFEDTYELQLIQRLVDDGRAFIKGLRVNLPRSRPLAAAVLNDTRPQPVALYVITPTATEAGLTALRELAAGSAYPAWYWQALPAGGIPALPAHEDFVGMAPPAAPIANDAADQANPDGAAETQPHADELLSS